MVIGFPVKSDIAIDFNKLIGDWVGIGWNLIAVNSLKIPSFYFIHESYSGIKINFIALPEIIAQVYPSYQPFSNPRLLSH